MFYNEQISLLKKLQRISKKLGIRRTIPNIVAVVGHARTGSNYLCAGLKAIPGVKVYNEIFAGHVRQAGCDFIKIYNQYLTRVEAFVNMVAFKVFYYHLNDTEWDTLLNNENIIFLHLTRKNKLKTIISLDKAFKTDRWLKTNERKESMKIHLSTDNLATRIKTIEQYENEFRMRIKNHKILELVYEDLVSNPEFEFMRISEFLNQKPVEISNVHLRKQGHDNVALELTNFQEVQSILAQTEYAEFIQ